MPISVIVPGYGGRARVVERWRVAVAVRTMSAHGAGRLIMSGHGGEDQRLAALAPPGLDIVLEPTARSTFENIERSIPLLLDAGPVVIATDRLHRRRALRYLEVLNPELLGRIVEPVYSIRQGWWMELGSATHELWIAARQLARSLRHRRHRSR